MTREVTSRNISSHFLPPVLSSSKIPGEIKKDVIWIEPFSLFPLLIIKESQMSEYLGAFRMQTLRL